MDSTQRVSHEEPVDQIQREDESDNHGHAITAKILEFDGEAVKEFNWQVHKFNGKDL